MEDVGADSQDIAEIPDRSVAHCATGTRKRECGTPVNCAPATSGDKVRAVAASAD